MELEKNATHSQSQVPLYSPAGFYLLRVPALPADTVFRLLSFPSHNTTKDDLEESLATARQSSYDAIREMLCEPLVELALTVASQDITKGLSRIRGDKASPRRLERAYGSVLRYLLRMCTRPTPFGLFAGVALGYLGTETTVKLKAPILKTIRTRPDMYWLLSLIQKIEADRDMRSQLSVVVNRTIYFAGGRVILPVADIYGRQDHRSVALRATPVVRLVLDLAKEPIPFLTLRASLLEAFPKATEQQVDNLLEQLWDHHVLMSTLRPPLARADPARYVLEQLCEIPGAASSAHLLQEVLAAAREIDQAGLGASPNLISALVESQRELIISEEKSGQHLYQIDASLNLVNRHVHYVLGGAVAQAIETLLRLGRTPHGPPYLREYYQAFVERYGMEAEVPLLELLSPEAGLDAPPTYREPLRTYPLPQHEQVPSEQHLDSELCSWLAEALATNSDEIELTDQRLRRLAQWIPETGLKPSPFMEMHVQVQAASYKAFNQGQWRAVVAPTCMAYGGQTFGRLFDILGMEAMEELWNCIRREEALSPEVIFAELSYMPTRGRNANVAIRPVLRDYEILVNTTPSVPPEQVILLDDLVVGVQGERFYLRSLRLGKRVIATQSHLLNPLMTPNVCRFLLEVSRSHYPQLSTFNWGVVRNAPFLPRVVQKQVVLSPTQWNLSLPLLESDVTTLGNGDSQWYLTVQNWRKRWRVPRYVYLTDFDNRLLLDLEHPLSLAELRTELKKVGEQGRIRLEEMLPAFEDLWIQDTSDRPYFAELVIPVFLNKTQKIQSATSQSQTSPRGNYPRIIRAGDRRQLPGDRWTFLKLYAAAKQHDEIITRAVREIIRRMQRHLTLDRWFYIRYADPEPHLRIRFFASHQEQNEQMLLMALAWSREVAYSGLIERVCVDTYEQEIERYGGPEAIDALERVFTVNSTSVSALVASLYQREISIDPLAVAVFSLDQLFDNWGLDFAARLHLLHKHFQIDVKRQDFREHRRLFCELLAPWDSTYNSALLKQRDLLLRLLVDQQSTLTEVGAYIRRLAAQGILWQSEEAILLSLAHMHVNRLLGINHVQEQKVYAFWRFTLENIQRRPSKG